MSTAESISESDEAFAAGFKEQPYWWDAGPPLAVEPEEPPRQVDVAIVGAGITGLNAAIVLARAGRSVAVFDAGDLGQGASSRNAGYLGRVLKHSFGEILKKQGLQQAVAVYREMQAAFETVLEVIATEQISCGLKRNGRFIMTRSQRQYDDLAAELELKKKHLGDDYAMIQGKAVRGEIATDRFYGGAVIPDLGAIHPGLYQRGLLDRARSAGVSLIGRTAVERIKANGGFELATAQGPVKARDVLLATNGYTDRLMPWLQRRVVPFNAYMIATEPLPADLIDRLLPTDRTYLDHVMDIDFMRRSPDATRILFGGRTGSRSTGLRAKALELRAWAARIIPEMARLKLSHGWTGRCAATFDLYPHIGTQDGIHFAGGYCFAGVPMGTYLGRKAAFRILGKAEGRTIFAERKFPTVPFYNGNPWFVPYMMKGYDWLDARASR
jgi:glycine/D-amino acid oxidase-like deaminating enzyme